MKSTEFCYWLQGFFEINNAAPDPSSNLTRGQVEMIQKHLNMVFLHEIDPSYPKEQQAALNVLHDGEKIGTTLFQPEPKFRC